jgi:excisionase family DNA binding protein
MDLKMYNQEELAAILGCHKDTVRLLRETKCIKCIKIGKQYMFSSEEIKNFQKDFLDFDLSNRLNMLKAKEIVDERRKHKKEA